MAPLPRIPETAYFPKCSGMIGRLMRCPLRWWISRAQQRDRLLDALAHPGKRTRQIGDLIARFDHELRGLQIAGADAVRQRRQLGYRVNDDLPQHQIKYAADRDEYASDGKHEAAKSGRRPLNRNGGRYRNDLRTNNVVQSPAEPIVGTVALDQGRGRGGRGTVTDETGGLDDPQRPGDEKGTACRCFALALDLGLRVVVAKQLDDVGLPVDRAIARIGRIQRRLLVRKLGKPLAQIGE